MTFPIPLLIDAIRRGAVFFAPCVIRDADGDHCGYRNEAERVIAINPEAPHDQIADDLANHLRALAATDGSRSEPTPPPEAGRLSLVHSTDRPEQSPEAAPTDESGPREVG